MMCSSCDEDFDDQSRGLQLLKCSHTLCQLCVKVKREIVRDASSAVDLLDEQELRHSDVITCNICQVTTECRDLRNVTTNERFLSNQVETEIVWCVTCGAPSTTSCPDHRTVHVPSQSLSTCKELQVKIENCKRLAGSVVQLRQSVVEQLSDKFKWLNSTADDVKRQLDELGQKFTSLTSTAADVQNQLTENQSKLQEASNWLANFNTAVNGQQTLKSLKEQVEAADQKWNSEFQEMSCLIKDLKSKNVENMETDEAVANTSTNDRSQRGARSEYKVRNP
jgi:flagellar biosynthesis chaperone FliJ